jgi:hypothetical protein
MSDLPIVPFGKYKGKPITDLIADKSYVDWCKQQDWFKKFPSVYNIVVHQTIQSNTNSKTPEHNRIQNMFLKDDFQNSILTFICDLSPGTISKILDSIYSNEDYIKYFGEQTIDTSTFNYTHSKKSIEFEAVNNWDVILTCKAYSPHITSIIKGYDSDFNKILYITNSCDKLVSLSKLCTCTQVPFDMSMWVDMALFIEIKPILSDDYPCVLRKMKSQIELTNKIKYTYTDYCKYYILLVDKFSSDVTTIEDIKTIFEQSNIKVILLDEIKHSKISAKYVTILEDEYTGLKEKIKEYETKLKLLGRC